MTGINRWCLASIVGVALGSGCSFYEAPAVDAAPVDAPPSDAPPTEGWRRVAVIDLEINRDVDILFMIDNSGSMAEEQTSLSADFPEFINVLASIEGGTPNMHIAVISSDVGAGPFNISNCSGNGDNGAFQTQARVTGCSPPTNSYISDVSNGAGGRTTNYSGTLAQTFSCIAELGTNGCGFEQQLESMRRALNGSSPGNNGFLRPTARLAVIFVTDEDDCSTRDTQMFDTSQNTTSDPLGPLSSFRCYEFGVDCETGNADPRAPGSRSNCFPREDSDYMYGVDEYVDFLKGLKDDESLVMVAAITGDREPVSVGVDPERPQNPALVPSCQSGAGRADASVRLGYFLDQFLSRNAFTTICNEDLSDGLALIGALLRETMSTTPCLPPVAGDLGQLEASCRAFDVIGLDTGAEQRTPLAACTQNGGAAPCFRFVADDRCTLNAARASVVVERGGTTPLAGTKVVVECPL